MEFYVLGAGEGVHPFFLFFVNQNFFFPVYMQRNQVQHVLELLQQPTQIISDNYCKSLER